jgi:hypothetical protein
VLGLAFEKVFARLICRDKHVRTTSSFDTPSVCWHGMTWRSLFTAKFHDGFIVDGGLINYSVSSASRYGIEKLLNTKKKLPTKGKQKKEQISVQESIMSHPWC